MPILSAALATISILHGAHLQGPTPFNPKLGPSGAPAISVTDFQDITPNDRCYEALQSLSERYGIVGPLKDKKFHPEMAMTWAEGYLTTYRLLNTAAKFFRDPDSGPGKAFYDGLKRRNNKPVKDLKALEKSLKGSEYGYMVVGLADFYKCYLGPNPMAIKINAAMTRAEAVDFYLKVFAPKAITFPWDSNSKAEMSKVISRGEFAILANDCMNDFVAGIS
ncbi:MAG: S-layer homology domain-containing protein [Armatimonadetes bacterium]|nr:S-layer homology domain-containing protein [Armatimonadota bacterium]